MALGTGAIIGLTVGVVLALGVVLLVGFLVCRMVYRHEHGMEKARARRRSSADSRGQPRLRSDTSGASIASGNTDFFVNKQEFNDMLANLEDSWRASKGPVDYGAESGRVMNGTAIYSNPAFDSDRGKSFDAAVAIQSWYRGIRTRQEMAGRKRTRIDGRRGSVASTHLVQMDMFRVKTFGLTPTGGHGNTGTESLLKCLETMHKKHSKTKIEAPSRYLRVWVTVKGLKVMSHEAWVIRHNIALKDIFSYTLSPQSERVFGMIFRRKGINYCFAVLCNDTEASSIKQCLDDAYQLTAVRRPISPSRSYVGDFLQTIPTSPSFTSEQGDLLSNLGSRRPSSSFTPHIPGIESSLPVHFLHSGDSEMAAITIQRWYKAYRIRMAYRRNQLCTPRRRSQSIELLPSLLLHRATFCASSPVTREAETDRETLHNIVMNQMPMIEHAPTQRLNVGVSCKGLSVLTATYTRILYKVPLRHALVYSVAQHNSGVFAVLFRSKAGLSSLVLKCVEADLLCKLMNEAQLASTLQQLERTKLHLPAGDSKRDLLESASSMVANLQPDGSEPAAADPARRASASFTTMSAPRPERVTTSNSTDSFPGQAAGPGRTSKSDGAVSLQPRGVAVATTLMPPSASSHSMGDIASDVSMTSEAFAAAARTLLDDTLKETEQYTNMPRSASKEMRDHVDEILSDSTVKLLDDVGLATPGKPSDSKPHANGGIAISNQVVTSTPLQAGRGEDGNTAADLNSTIQELLQL
ncbi:uncharacterized protein LOC135811585 [Sycon ciliatum]|uniref:uncharacterized protein LOC135811585 n=1 Tax=Sycon ciliatum TaxID=27933 RepID=UPI0031F65582